MIARTLCGIVLSVLAVGAQASGIVWNQTPEATYQFINYSACFSGGAVENTLSSQDGLSHSVSCQYGGATAQVSRSGMSINGGTFTGSAAASLTNGSNGIGHNIDAGNSALFDVLAPGGIDIQVDLTFSRDTTVPNQTWAYISGFGIQGMLTDGCNDIVYPGNCVGGGIIPFNYPPSDSATHSWIVHLDPGTYYAFSRLWAQAGWVQDYPNNSSYVSYTYSIQVINTPIPAAFWLFGGALTGLGLLKRKAKT